MSSYPQPSSNLTIFNNTNYTYAYDNLSYLTSDRRYVKLSGNSTITGTLNVTGAMNYISSSSTTGNTTLSSNLIVTGNLSAGTNYLSVANGSVMIGTVNPTSTGVSCPLLVQPSTTSNNPWLNGICCYGNLTANAVITASVQNSGLNCWFALANRFGNSWVIANDNGTNSGNPLRFQASQDFSNVNANMMSLTRSGNLLVHRAIGIGNASPVAPLYVTAGGSTTDPATNGILVANMNNSSGNNAIITCRTGGASAGSPMISLDIFNVAGWSILQSNTLNNCLSFNSQWNGTGTDHMVILRPTGNVGVGTTTPPWKLSVYGTFGIFPTGGTGTERLRFYSDNTSGDVIQIRATINSGATYWYYNTSGVVGTISDRRVKCNISDLNVDESVEFIKKMKPRKFNYKDVTCSLGQMGFIAQELLESCVCDIQKSVIANHKTYNENDPDCPSLGLNHNLLLPVIVQTLQKLLSDNSALENRVTQLEEINKRFSQIIGGHYF